MSRDRVGGALLLPLAGEGWDGGAATTNTVCVKRASPTRKRERLQRTLRSPRHHARKMPPVFLVTSATIFAATASISWSVKVFSRGWIVTAMATDFLSGSMPLPS